MLKELIDRLRSGTEIAREIERELITAFPVLHCMIGGHEKAEGEPMVHGKYRLRPCTRCKLVYVEWP